MEQVNHPTHYNAGKIEVIEAIEDWKLNFHRGNAVKYTARAGKKNPAKEIEDLEKAVWYLKREIETLQAIQDGRSPVRPNDMNPRSTSATGAWSSKAPDVKVDTATSALPKRDSDLRCISCGRHISERCERDCITCKKSPHVKVDTAEDAPSPGICFSGEWIENDHKVTVFVPYDRARFLLGKKGSILFIPEIT